MSKFALKSLTGKLLLGVLCFLIAQPVAGQWRRQDSGTLTNLHSVFFVDSVYGWVVGAGGTFLATVDGGESWKLHKGITRDLIRDVHFSDRRNGWLLCEDSIYERGDRSPSYLLRTNDGGLTWERVDLPQSRDRLLKFIFTKKGLGFAIGEGGAIWQMLDDLRSWRRKELPSRLLILGGAFTDEFQGFLVGAAGTVLSTSDGGVEWRQTVVLPGPKSRLNSLFFMDKNTGWIAGDGGMILWTIDGGKTWREQKSGIIEDFADVFFLNSQDGFVVGDKGTLLETTTGGSKWTVVESGIKSPLSRLHFVSRRGFAVGFGGVILKYIRAR